MRITHTLDSLKLAEFAEKHCQEGRWHTYKRDKKTIKAVKRAELLGAIKTNEHDQFNYAR
jgi:hypothetical protein